MIESIKLCIKNSLEQYYLNTYNQNISIVVEEPKNASLGDISVPMFSVVKTLRKPMPQIIEEALPIVNSASNAILKTQSVGAFINVFIDRIFFNFFFVTPFLISNNHFTKLSTPVT